MRYSDIYFIIVNIFIAAAIVAHDIFSALVLLGLALMNFLFYMYWSNIDMKMSRRKMYNSLREIEILQSQLSTRRKKK